MITYEASDGKEILINETEMNQIIEYIRILEDSFQNKLAPKLQALANTKYYEGGEASKAMEHYAKMLNKVNEVGDHYRVAYGQVYYTLTQWQGQDATLGSNINHSS